MVRAKLIVALAGFVLASCASGLRAQEAADALIGKLVPELEAYIRAGMTGFDDPGLAIGIVAKDRLVYAKGFGTRRKGGEPVDTRTVFQIGSTTKAFLATTMAIAVDRKALAWDDRVVDRFPDFEMKDSWVTREFRVFDLLAQRSGLPPSANDFVGLLGADQSAMIRSLRIRRAGLELPVDLRLHQHHAHACAKDRCAPARRRRLEHGRPGRHLRVRSA